MQSVKVLWEWEWDKWIPKLNFGTENKLSCMQAIIVYFDIQTSYHEGKCCLRDISMLFT